MLRHHVLGVHSLLVSELFVFGVHILLIAEMSCVGFLSSLNCSGRQLSVVL